MRFSLKKALAGAAVLAALATVSPFIGGIPSAAAATNNGPATMNPTSGTKRHQLHPQSRGQPRVPG